MTIKNDQDKASHDSAWKDIIDAYLPEVMYFCFPDFYAEVDWSKKWIPLDKEFQAISRRSRTGKLYVDKLIRVYLKNGESPWILIHLELEQNPKANFPQRMFLYSFRSYDRYRHPIYSCAILTDLSQTLRPRHFEVKVGDSKLRLDFPLCKLLDFEQRREELEKSSSPFATVILCHLDAVLAKKLDDNQKLQTKTALAKRLYKKGFSKTDIFNIYRFLDFSIALPEAFELEYQDEIYKTEEETHMPYLSNIERRAIERVKQAKQEAKQEAQQQMQQQKCTIAENLLKKSLDHNLISEVTGLELNKIHELKERIDALATAF